MLEPTIGIEVHVELKSDSKVFSDSQNEYSNNPNIFVNVIDLGYPGTLPKLNKKVIDMALSAALAFNCKINQTMHFDRKNYFYPDLPKGYQITQSATPIGYDGYVEINVNGNIKKIGIERIHIEEDTCKSIHSEIGTLLNANRAGVPLIEIVSKPDIKSAEEAALYLEKLREILLYLGVSDVKMEEGSMRCDANVSLKEKDSNVLGTKTEIKNINSINNVKVSIDYEINRQKELLQENKKITEETRRFDDKTNTTILMRVKETGNDYRYFPEPDIPFVIIDDDWLNDIKSKMPVFADELKEKYYNLGINDNNVKTIISRLDLCQFLETVIDDVNPIMAANILTGDVLSYLNKNNLLINRVLLNKDNFKELIKLLEDKKISSKQSKEIIPFLLENGGSVSDIMEKLGIKLMDNEQELENIIKEVLNNNPESVNDYKNGKDRALKFLMGQIMKETKGQANPQIVNELLIKLL